MSNGKDLLGIAMRHGLPNGDQLVAYIEDGCPVGGFLKALISNDLRGTYDAADIHNTQAVRDYVLFLYNHAPSACWGSPERYDAWLKFKQEERDAKTDPA